jgi:outer membrane protein TolC
VNRCSYVFGLVLVVALATTAHAQPRKITIDEAIALAVKDSVPVDVGTDKVEAASQHKRATTKLRLPSLSVRGSILVWDDNIEAEFAPGAPPIVIRNQITGDVSVTLAQPLTAAAVLGRLIAGDEAGIDAARAELEIAKLDVAFQAAEAYLGALQLQTLRDVAATSVKQLDADLVKIKALRDARVLSDLDVLRLEAAREQARQQELESEVGLETAVRGLALLLDLPDGTRLELAPVDLTPPAIAWTEDAAVERAKSNRPERRVAAARAKQADVGVDVARANYLPSINAIATYTHSEQGGPFQIKDSAFVGLQLEWNLWDWGKRGAEVAEARAVRRQAERARDALDQQLAFDVRSKWLAASAKRKTLDVAASALEAAEEAYRLQSVKIQGGAATSTDVIDAEAEVARARAQATIARYQYLIAWMALGRAVGQVPNIGAK